ncbi:hypothetical protein [Sphingomonas rubra]|uniref:Uncharacterized protein n=1 Tax=Sphingomonas rubra TaxID=634430 RepID=A0A1I5TAJ7_9SPHN|nr:hypothetical protein [Sphingomonas rubra]SFP79998.1 hypothetical protein SAMN04488241_107178 [Sphingomonas rubra]
MAIYNWHDIGDVPFAPGVYAWYYTPEITAFDLDRITSDILELKAGRGTSAAKDAVRDFLDETVFRYFREQPYSAQLRGPLKPRYEGQIEHRPTLSESLLERIVEEPARLATIRTVLEASAPNSASPIYIGMSERLRTRLGQHKALIEKYGELPDPGASEEDQRDHSFAKEVRARSIPPSRLFVVATVIAGPPGTYVDIENILNRIHYPLLGRN